MYISVFYYQVLFSRVITACSVNSKSQNTIFYLLFSLNPSCVFVCLVTVELTAFSSRNLIKIWTFILTVERPDNAC